MPYTLPKLPYSYDALEPYIDARTMEIHYTKHHQGYVDNLNKALLAYPDLNELDVVDLLKRLHTLPSLVQTAVRNQGGGHANHSFFWNIMQNSVGKNFYPGLIRAAIDRSFGSFLKFQELFNKEAMGRFGSGWAWLVVDKGGGLLITSTANQDSPYLEGHIPLLGLDLWEHAYYLFYQNRRIDYVAAWWSVVNWDQVEENYRTVLGK